MPVKIERKLRERAKELYPDDKEKQDRYIFGTLYKIKKQSKE